MDWLDNLAQGIGDLFAGDHNTAINAMVQASEKHPGDTQALYAAVSNNAYDHLSQDASYAAKPISWAVSMDPTQAITKPVVHALGGSGTEWDTGLLGMVGNAFDKAGRYAAYTAAAGPDSILGPNQSFENRKAWDLAFAGGPEHLTFGEAMTADSAQLHSILYDPNGLENYKQQIAGTWYGHAMTGALDFAMYAAVDPTKGLAKGAEAVRAANYVADSAKADKLASALNTTLDNGGTLAKPSVVQRGVMGQKLTDAATAGYQWHSKAAFDNVTDVNEILNKLEPNLGMGGGATKGALPSIAEMYADASKVTSDTNLQRQIKLNIDYALTGSSEAMNWLAKEYPGIAAKGRRMSGAPSEFTLLEDAMGDYAAARNVSGFGDKGQFDLGSWVDRHYSDPAQQAELMQYGDAIDRLNRFRSQIWESGPEGGPVEFGTTGAGVQVAPRNLEKLKTAINQRVADSYIFQDGATGRTIHVVTSLTTPGAHGYISLVDPILGNRQLTYTLRQYADNVGGVDADFIRSKSEDFLKLDPGSREKFVRETNDQLLAMIGQKYGFTPDQTAELIQETSQAYRDGRKYASDVALKASKAGNPQAYLGDLGGTDTYLDTQHLLSHLNDTAGILDWQTADWVVRSFKEGTHTQAVMRDAKQMALKGIASYHTLWKHAQLGRVGLVFRVLMDTDLRANAMIGSGSLLMQSLNGALAMKRNGALPFLAGNELDSAISSMSYMQANEVRRAGQEIASDSARDLTRAQAMFGQIKRADELADIFKARQRQSGRFHAQTNYYKQQEQAARDLAARLRGDVNPQELAAVSMAGDLKGVAAAKAQQLAAKKAEQGAVTPFMQQPRSISAVQKSRDAAEQARFDAQGVLSNAEEHYLTPEEYKFANATKRRTYTYNGVQVRGSMVENDMQLASLPDEVRGSSAGLSDLLLNNMDTHLWQGRQEANHWQGNVPADSVNWSKKYAIAMQQMRESHTMQRMLIEGDAISEKTPKAVLRSFMDDPAVVNEFRQTVGGGTREDFTRWLSDIATSVKSMTSHPELKQRLMDNKVLTPEEIDDLVPAEERFPIFGPNIVNDRVRNLGKKALDGFYKTFVDMPDVYMARIPTAVGLYHKNMQMLLPSYAQKALDRGRNYLLPEEARDLHLRAKGRALNDARRDMYDIHRRLGSEGVMRYIAPFFAPWFDAMGSWSRLIYDDPSRFGQLMRYSQTPDMFNLTTDPNGNPVAPWDGTQLQDKTIHVPLLGIGGLQSFGVNFGSMNTITQGNTPFSPGAGPLAQIAGTVVVGKVLPAVAPDAWKWMQANPNNLISQSLFMRPGDVPKADAHTLAGTQMPSWMRTMSDVFMGSNGFGNTYTNAFGTRYNDLIRQWREDHGGADPNADALRQIEKDASSGASAAALARSVVSFNLGLSGNAVPQGQFYVDRMHQLTALSEQLRAMGTTPEQVFAQTYPSASNLNWSYSVNDGHLQATVNATTSYLKNRKLMDQNPDVMWWIAGPDNLVTSTDPNAQFSQGAYNQQMTLALRRKFDKDELVKQGQIAMGQGRLNAFNSALRLYMAQNGITSLSAKNAGGLSAYRQNYIDGLRAQFPDWAAYYDSLNSQGMQDRQIAQIQAAMEEGGPTFRSRPDVVTTQRYLTARDAVIAQAQAQGVTGWQNANSVAPLRGQLYALGMQLARQDVVFGQAWDRLFSHEFNHDISTARQEQLAKAFG